MLDENLPTFRSKPSPDHSHSSVIWLTQNGAEPTAEYLLRRPDPSQPASRNKYAVALCSPVSLDIVYAEVVVEPEWTQPTLSAAELRAQNGAIPALVPVVPDSFSVLLYNPDQTVAFKLTAAGWNRNDSWEFEMPTQTFKVPSASELDRRRQNGAAGPVDLVPRIMFRWKKDGRLTKDMTCYMTGKNLGGQKSKEPDITVALFKAGRDSGVTIYQPNLHRVDLEDMKGFEVVLLLAAEVIRDLYLAPQPDLFNASPPSFSAASPTRKSPVPGAGTRLGAAPPPAAMSGALGAAAPLSKNSSANPLRSPEIDAETRRLQAMVEREEREERERRERAEEERIRAMLEEEERQQRRRRQAEVDRETERLRAQYGTEGQALPASPPLPPRPLSVGPTAASHTSQSPSGQGRKQNAGASVSTLFGRNKSDEERRKVQKKRSSHW